MERPAPVIEPPPTACYALGRVTIVAPLRSLRVELALLRTVIARFSRHHGFVLAGALAFSLLLCLAPLALVLLSVAGYLLEQDAIAERVFDAVVLVFPGYGTEAARLLAVLVAERQVTGVIGTAGLAVFATQLFSLLRGILNTAFAVPVRRTFFRGFIFDLAVVALIGTAWTVLVGALVVLGALGDVLHGVPGLGWLGSGTARDVGLTVVTYVVGTLTLVLIYRVFPNTRVSCLPAFVAALVVMALWEIGRMAFGAYITLFGVYGKLYGSVGIGVALLVWLYYSTSLVVFGGELAAVVADTEDAATTADPDPGELR